MQKRLFLILTLITLLCRVEAQAEPKNQVLPLKIGYTNVEYILSLLPETKSVEAEYASFEKQLRNQLEIKWKEYQQKGQALEQGSEAMTEAIRNKKLLELQQLEKSLEQLQLEAREKLANKQAGLLKPLYEKIQSMIEEVAKKNGYTHIFNSNTGGVPVLLYASEEHDISELVLKKLGVKSAKSKKKK